MCDPIVELPLGDPIVELLLGDPIVELLLGDPIVELPLGDPKRLAVFQNPPMRILSRNTLKV
jgi:hypothetical protein